MSYPYETKIKKCITCQYYKGERKTRMICNKLYIEALGKQRGHCTAVNRKKLAFSECKYWTKWIELP